MAVRFRYRSSPRFDSLDLAGAGTISVRDLRARILGPALRRHFGLLISDAASNRTLDDDALLIPAGSDLVVKRVPIDSVHGGGDSSAPPAKTAGEQQGCGRGDRGEGITSLSPPLHNFDDTSKDICPDLEAALPESYADGAKLAQSSNQRCSKMSRPRYPNIKGSGLSEAMPEGKREIEISSKAEHGNMERSVAKSSQAIPNMDSPAELRCFLCKTIFQDAVMIPCCQHSFCNKCIVSALADMKKCPKCSSPRCSINDLLPNLSLRKAIKHFVETQPAGVVAFDDPGPMYAPDVESGIEAKEASCALSIHQQDQKLPCSPSATGKDSNQIMPTSKEIKKSSSIKIRLDRNIPNETASGLPQVASRNAAFQGNASSSKVYQNITQESDNFPTLDAKADDNGFAAPSIRSRKGGRTCYRCGSPSHLIRDCPVASNVQTEDSAFHRDAHGPPNWQGSIFHPLQPFGNIYGTPGIVPFDPGVVPVSPFGVTPYIPSFYGGIKNPYAFMGMGGMPSPVLPGVQQPISHAGFMGVHANVKTQKAPSERGVREYNYDSGSEDYYDEVGRRTSHKQYQTEKRSERYSDEGSARIEKWCRRDKFCSPTREKPCYSSDEELVDHKHRKEFDSYGREGRKHYSERSAAELHDMPDNSIQVTKQMSKQHHRRALGKRDESRATWKSDYGEYTHHQSRKEKSHIDRGADGHKSSENTHRHKHRDQETAHLTHYKRDSKIKAYSQSSRHAKTKVGSSDGHLGSDRWEMVDDRPDDYERRDHYRHKRKRIH